MKKVTRTKEPTLKQISNMSSNLHEKYKDSVSVEVKAPSYYNNIIYTLYISKSMFIKDYNSWKECQDAYLKLMEDAPNA